MTKPLFTMPLWLLSCSVVLVVVVFVKCTCNWQAGAFWRGSRSNRVVRIGIRTEVSRHFMEIIVLGFGTCRLGFPPALARWTKSKMIRRLAIMLWAKCNAMKPTYMTVYQEYIKAPMDDKYLSFSCTQHPGHAKPDDTGSRRFTQKHERIGSQYKSKTSNMIVTSFYTISRYCTRWRPLQSSSSSSRAPLSVLLSRRSVSRSQLLQAKLCTVSHDSKEAESVTAVEHRNFKKGCFFLIKRDSKSVWSNGTAHYHVRWLRHHLNKNYKSEVL
jgi:hypothetical protein